MFNTELSNLADRVASDIGGLRSQLAALEAVRADAAFVLDARNVAKRADELAGMTTQAIEAKAASEKADREHAAAVGEREARIAEREAEIAAIEARWTERTAKLDAREVALSEDGHKAQLQA